MQKTIELEGVTHPIILARRKGARHLRLSVKSDGTVRVTVPYGVPEFLAKKFVASKKDWITKHVKKPTNVSNETHIGKNHRLILQEGAGTRSHSKVTDTEIRVTLPSGMSAHSAEAQKIIKKACEKALLQEAERLLPQRLATLAQKTGIIYRSSSVKKLKSRWGACDNHGNITLNSYLIQLDWPLVDYVIYHELAHTRHHHHQESFWELVSQICPNYKVLRKELKSKPTEIIA